MLRSFGLGLLAVLLLLAGLDGYQQTRAIWTPLPSSAEGSKGVHTMDGMPIPPSR